MDGCTFSVREGEVHGLIGPNGAGKTTVFNGVTGLPMHELNAMVGRILPPFSLILPTWLIVTMVGWKRALQVLPALVTEKPLRNGHPRGNFRHKCTSCPQHASGQRQKAFVLSTRSGSIRTAG